MFDLGNLVAIGITLILLLAYRLLDRDNRSLEKVKRYADKLREEMAAFADKGSEDLKSYAIELEVHQKAAKEVLRRVQVAEDALNARAEQIGGMAARIAEYDKALAELRDMSARVDENLAAIHDESAFVDGVARTLKASKDEIERLKASVPGIREGIASDSKDMMDDLRSVFSDEIRSALDDAQAQVEALRERAREGTDAVAETNAEAVRAAEERFRAIEAQLADAFKRAREEGERLEDSSFQKLQGQIEARGAKLGEAIEDRFNALRDQAKEKIAETQGMLKSFKAEWRKDADAVLAELKAEAQDAADRSSERIDEAEAKVAKAESLYEERYARIEAKAHETAQALQLKVKEQLKAYQEDSAAKQAAIRSAIKEGLVETKGEAEAAAAELAETLAAFRSRIDETASEQASRIAAMNSSLSAAERKADDAVAALSSKFTDRGADLEKRVLAGFEARATELRDVVESGLSRLEGVRLDADRMEAALRDSMAGVERRVEEDFALFGKDLASRQAAFEEEFRGESARVKSAVKDLDSDLSALKSKAYADVSEKLKIFEDEFFTDLRVRSEDANERFAVWRAEMDDRLASTIREADAARAETDKAWSEEARAKLAETQARVQDQLEKLASQVDAHRSAISERVGEADDALATLKAAVKADLDDARAAADAYMNAELERWKHAAGERVRGAERQADADAKALVEAAEAAKRRFEEARAAIIADSGEWKARFTEAMTAAESDRVASVAALAESFKTDVASISESWEKERRKVIEAAKLERDSLARDVRALSDDVGRFRQELAQKTAQALDDFNRSYDGLSQDAARKARESAAAMDAAIEDYKREARSLKDGFEAAKSQMTGSLDEEKKARQRAFAEMDKEVKAFQASTKLFERTDELRSSLSEAMESMKADLSRVESRRAEMAELETQYGRVKRLEDELGQKIAKFLAEKRRLDAMEEDFKRLLSLSQAVDQKLAAVTANNDQLTQIQAEVRRLSDISDEAAEKYDRIEKKSNILDSTADAVDKSFQAIGELERNVRAIDAEVREIPDRVIDLKRSMDEVMSWKPKLDAAVVRLDEVDGVLVDAEKRVTELQKARDWLARAETRFDELNKKTQDHLKLLNDILKDEPSSGRKDKGAPPISVQETVRKLAHQGWKVEEIARAVKLSRGEVELILELGGQD
ncbi:MAG: hypothetical protein KKA67_11425 [Spirochaetes bacterium]|nr:hypothetical protein [Spirochaetota bacterium]MBU1081180.1 hypothetical protein [Spirochaetota bacterium]